MDALTQQSFLIEYKRNRLKMTILMIMFC